MTGPTTIRVMMDNRKTLRRKASTLTLGRRACKSGHLRQDAVRYSNNTQPNRLKPRNPPTPRARQLTFTALPQEFVRHLVKVRWAESRTSTTTTLHRFVCTHQPVHKVPTQDKFSKFRSYYAVIKYGRNKSKLFDVDSFPYQYAECLFRKENQSLNRSKLLWPRLILLSNVHCNTLDIQIKNTNISSNPDA